MHLYRTTFAAGFAAGFVVGTRAGREKYDQMVKIAKATKDSPAFQQAAGTIQTQATGLLSTAGHKVADNVPHLAQSAMHTVGDRIPLIKQRNGNGNGNGKPAANGNSGSGRPFAGTSNSHLRPASE
jgi:hypothetical protein